MYSAQGVDPTVIKAKYDSVSDMDLDKIEDLATAKKQIERAREKAEKYRVERDEHRDVASGAYGFKAQIKGLQTEVEKLKNDKDELRNTLSEYEAKLLGLSGASVNSRYAETVKALQTADLAQRKTISNQLIDIEYMLVEIKMLRRLLADTDIDLEGVQTWEEMRPNLERSEWNSTPTAGSLGLTGGDDEGQVPDGA